MNDFMYKIMNLLDQGRTVVAKKGDKADPEELAMAVLQYCEGADYTIDEVVKVYLAINRSIRENDRLMEQNTKFSANVEVRF